jgi:hypothetical protein
MDLPDSEWKQGYMLAESGRRKKKANPKKQAAPKRRLR